METFHTLAGDLEVLAGVSIAGSTLRLVDISVAFADHGIDEAGYRVLRGVMEQIVGAASAQGFEALEFQGTRIGGATPNRRAFARRRQL